MSYKPYNKGIKPSLRFKPCFDCLRSLGYGIKRIRKTLPIGQGTASRLLNEQGRSEWFLVIERRRAAARITDHKKGLKWPAHWTEKEVCKGCSCACRGKSVFCGLCRSERASRRLSKTPLTVEQRRARWKRRYAAMTAEQKAAKQARNRKAYSEKESYRRKASETARKHRAEITDLFVCKKLGIKAGLVPVEIIDLKRQHIRLCREIWKIETNKTTSP